MWTSIFTDLDVKIYSNPLLHIANVACASARECEVHKSIYRKGMGWSLLSCLFCSLCTGPESFYREFAFEVPTPTAQQQTKVNPDQQQPLQQKQQQQGNRRVSPPQTAEQQQRSGQRPFPFTSVKAARRISDSFAPPQQIRAPPLESFPKSTFCFDCEYCE